MRHLKQQRGISMMGFLFIAIVLAMVGTVVIKLMPFYQEYAGIKRSIEQLKQVPDIKNSSETDVIAALMQKLYVNDVRSITATDLEKYIKIEPVENTQKLKVDYAREAPLFSNVYIVAKFKEDFTL